MKTYELKFEYNGVIIHTTERAFTFKGAYRKAMRKAAKRHGNKGE